ncbi:MAG: hypothetical protein RQ847_03625 [Wenzhouxiangellaceae bacterium]|nr:hypothetical protein [Wenzhouxiangellaceae bacterium]
MYRTTLVWTILSITGLALAGCATDPDLRKTHACPDPCVVEIQVADPNEPDNPPRVEPQRVDVSGSHELHFNVTGTGGNNAALTLVFEEAIVRPGQGNWLYRVNLTHGNNEFDIRPYSDGLCVGVNGCKYVVINRGRPDRRSLINSPMVRILR